MSPLIFICTDSTGEKINIGKNLFTDSIRQQFQIHHIRWLIVIGINSNNSRIIETFINNLLILQNTIILKSNFQQNSISFTYNLFIFDDQYLRYKYLHIYDRSKKTPMCIVTKNTYRYGGESCLGACVHILHSGRCLPILQIVAFLFPNIC